MTMSQIDAERQAAIRREREVQEAQRLKDAGIQNANEVVPYAPPILPRRPIQERVNGMTAQIVDSLRRELRDLKPHDSITIKRNPEGDGRAPFTMTVRTHE